MKDNARILRKGVRLVVVIWMVFVLGVYSIVVEPKTTAEAATLEQTQTFREELKEMILTGDASVHDISKYNLKFYEANLIWLDLISGECVIAYQSSIYMIINTTSNSSSILQTINLKNIDSGYMDRYNKMRATIEGIRSGMDPNMTDVDKVLYYNDYLTNNTVYKNIGNYSYLASGPLLYGYAVCSGYAEALKTLLSLEGIKNSRVHSATMNHTWVYAQLDGSWYHIDPTWNDTGSYLTSGKSRSFLLRNDSEFTTNSTNKHYGWYVSTTQEESISTKYSNWFVHDVVGKMLYYNGLWYYVNQVNNELLASDIDGNKFQKLVIGNGKSIVIDEINKGVLYYTYEGKQNTIDLNEDFIETVEFTPIVEEVSQFTEVSASLVLKAVTESKWNDFDNWRTGNYNHTNGLYKADVTRICLQDYVPFDSGATYSVVTSNNQYQVLIREMTKDLKFVKSYNLKDGGTFTTTENTAYLAISLYNAITTAKDYSTYQTLFDSGYKVDIVKKQTSIEEAPVQQAPVQQAPIEEAPVEQAPVEQAPVEQAPVEQEPIEQVAVVEAPVVEDTIIASPTEDDQEVQVLGTEEQVVDSTVDISPTYIADAVLAINYADFSNWRTGEYYYLTGVYKANQTRICINDYLACSENTVYHVTSSQKGYNVLVREMSANKTFIKSHNLSDGASFTTSANTEYLAISVYYAGGSSTALTYDHYKQMFESGYIVTIK